MSDVVLSIQPKWVTKIRSGEKSAELRRRLPKKDPDRYYVYETAPVQMIVGYLTGRAIRLADPAGIWNQYRERLAMSREEFGRYVGNREAVSVILIESYVSICRVSPKDCGIWTHPPQDWRYIDGEKVIAESEEMRSFMGRCLVANKIKIKEDK